MIAPSGYNLAQIVLHWLIAAGILTNYFVSDHMGRAFYQKREGLEITVPIVDFHIWTGSAIMFLVLLRMVLRFISGVPRSEPTVAGFAAHAAHLLLYALMVMAPVAGLIGWFLNIEWLADAHVYLVNTMVVLVIVHAAAALFHHIVLKDDTLCKMLRPQASSDRSL